MEKDNLSILYIGNSERMLRILLDTSVFLVEGIICEKGKITQGILQSAEDNHIAVYKVQNKRQVEKVFYDTGKTLAVMYDFGIIISEELTKHADIFNFHPGSLKTNRGSSPVNWSILLGEKQTEISLHKIVKEIDKGILISKRQCDIRLNDIPSLLRSKLESFIPEMLYDLHSYLNGKIQGKAVEEGIYRKRIEEKDYTIDLIQDNLLCVNAKICSQADYKGAILNIDGNKYYIKNWAEIGKYLGYSNER